MKKRSRGMSGKCRNISQPTKMIAKLSAVTIDPNISLHPDRVLADGSSTASSGCAAAIRITLSSIWFAGFAAMKSVKLGLGAPASG